MTADEPTSTRPAGGEPIRTDRTLLLRGGPLDGGRWSGIAGVGSRVAAGPRPWTASHVYVVTATEVPDGERTAWVAVPASFA